MTESIWHAPTSSSSRSRGPDTGRDYVPRLRAVTCFLILTLATLLTWVLIMIHRLQAVVLQAIILGNVREVLNICWEDLCKIRLQVIHMNDLLLASHR